MNTPINTDASPFHLAIGTLQAVCYLGLMGCAETMQQDKEYPILATYIRADQYTQMILPKAQDAITLKALAIGWYTVAKQVREELVKLPDNDAKAKVMVSLDQILANFNWVNDRIDA